MSLSAITSLLQEHLASDLAAAFIYGSFAYGNARAGSDIDCFVLTSRELAPDHAGRLAARFAGLQRALGFTPDPDHPVEIFSVAACGSLLADATLATALRQASVTGTLDPRLAYGDPAEVLRALLDRRLVLRPAPVLDVLTTRAHALISQHAPHAAPLRRALGLAEGIP
jgi:predicted nucleotidyltransferase